MKRYQIVSYISIIAILLSFAISPVGSVLAGDGNKGNQPALAGQGLSFKGLVSAIKQYLPLNDITNYYVIRSRKYADAELINAGEPIGFSLRLVVLDQQVLTNVTLTDQLDPTLGWTENSPFCEIDDLGLLTCNFGDMAPGDTASVHITALSNPSMCGILSNTSTVIADNVNPIYATATVEIACQPNVSIEKSPIDPTIEAGETAGYTLLVTSDGDGTAQDVTLQDILPAIPGTSWTVGSESDGSCQITDGVLNCSFGNIPTGETRTVTLTSPTSGASCGELDNTATVFAANQQDAQEGDDSDSAAISVTCTNLVLEKIADDDVIDANDQIGFNLTVTNTGITTATNVVLDDQLPANVVWSEDSGACSISTDNLLSCTFGSLAPSGSASVHVTGMSSAAVCGEMSNTATASAGNIIAPVSDTATVQVNCAPSLSVRKIAENSLVTPGSPIGYTITATNTGTAPAEGVTIRDILPVDSTLTWDFENVTTGSCDINDGELNCAFGTLAAGESASVRLFSALGTDTCETITNTVEADATNTEIVSDQEEVEVLCSPNIEVEKVAEMAEIHAGVEAEPARFTITVTSNGLGAANNVILTDNLPTINGLSWTIESETVEGSCQINNGVLTCDFGTMASGTTNTVVVSSPTNPERFCLPGSAQIIDNSASVTSSNELDGQLLDNSDYAYITVVCPAEPLCIAPNETYEDDFNTGTSGAAYWSDYKISTSPNGSQTFLGDFGNKNLVFDYTDTNPNGHVQIMISFDLYVIRSWDGNTTLYSRIGRIVGPDIFSVNVLGDESEITQRLFNSTFSNFQDEYFLPYFSQSYPDRYLEGDWMPRTGAREINSLGYTFVGERDSIYHITLLFPHSDPNIHISFADGGLQTLLDESWGIDNFKMLIVRCSSAFDYQSKFYLPYLQVNPVTPEVIITSEMRTEEN